MDSIRGHLKTKVWPYAKTKAWPYLRSHLIQTGRNMAGDFAAGGRKAP